MDHRLVAWARAVKARSVKAGGRSALPPLWLFTDPSRMEVGAAVRGLPAGLCGVVFRHDAAPDRDTLLRDVARTCRARRLALSIAGAVAGAGGLTAGLGRHRRAGRPGSREAAGWITSSAHGRAELVAARRGGAALVFLSPVFPTASHPGAPALGVARWSAMARGARDVAALGGVTGRTVRRLPRSVRHAGAIGALLDERR